MSQSGKSGTNQIAERYVNVLLTQSRLTLRHSELHQKCDPDLFVASVVQSPAQLLIKTRDGYGSRLALLSKFGISTS